MSGNKQSSVETIAAEYVETFLATGMAYEFTAESIAHRSFIDGYTAGSREVGQLKGALALGQENCDAEYEALRREREIARDGLRDSAKLNDELNAELAELRRDQKRLDWLIAHSAFLSHSRDGEVCNVWFSQDPDDDSNGAVPAQGYPQKCYGDAREAVDAAMKGGANG